MDKSEAMDYFKTKVIEASVPLSVAIIMLAATWHIVSAVKQEILAISADAANKAVTIALASVDPPIEWISGRALTPEIKVGDTLEIEYKALIKKQCPADVRSFLLDDSDSAVYRFPDQPGGYRRANPEPQTIVVKIKINDPPIGSGLPPLEPGSYVYRSNAVRYCERFILDSNIPDVHFKLSRNNR